MGNQGKEQELNKRHQAFAELIVGGATATDAYLAAGYSGAKRDTVHRNASRLRRDPRIRAVIRNLRYEAEMIAREDTILDVARKLTYLARLVTTGAGGLSQDDELIQYSRTFKDGSTATRLPCKLKALKLHSQLAGHFDPKPEDLAPPKEPEKSFDEELQELYDEIRSGRRANGGHRSVDAVESTGQNGRIPEGESSNEGRAGFSEPADLTSGSREAASRVPESESPTSEGRASASNHSEIRDPQSALADVAPTSATPSHEENPTNQNSNPHPTTSSSAAKTPPIPKSAFRNPQLNYAPQPFPYSGHDFPELYGPKVRLIR